MDARTTTLLDLAPYTLRDELAKPGNLDTGSVINLSLANKYTYQLFKPTLFLRLKKYVERSAKRQVEALLKIHSDFDVSDLRNIFLAALKDRDIDMCKAITEVRKDVLEQIELPKKFVVETNTYDFSAVVSAIESRNNVEEVLAKMRTDLDKIVKEKGFPFQALLDAYEIYDNKFDPWINKRGKLFSIKVLGYLQRLSPDWLKKALATGVYHIAAQGKMVCANNYRLQSGESIDPARAVPNKGLGFDFCVNIMGNGRVVESASWGVRGRGNTLSAFRKLFKAKTTELGELMQRPPKLGGCVIV